MQDEICITVIATGLTAHSARRRYPGLNRPRVDIQQTNSLNVREIPAIDRIEQISEEVSKETNANIFGSSNDMRVEKIKNNGNDNDKKMTPPPQKDFAPKIHKVNIPEMPSYEKPVNIQPIKNGQNGFSEEDYDIPACRRKRWSLF